MKKMEKHIPIKLWEGEAPHAQGNTAEDQPSLIPFLLDKQEQHSAVIVCPGGGYWVRAEHEGEPIARWLNQIGISAFVLHYRVHPYQHPTPLLDAKRALRLVRHHAQQWNIDTQKIGILGFSAGGHLASTAGTHYDLGIPNAQDKIERESSRPDFMVLGYPVISMIQNFHEGSLLNLLGENSSRAEQESLSSETQVNENTPPTFLWHTADDDGVPAENSLLFAQSLIKHRVPYELHIFQNGKHGLGLAENNPEVAIWTTLCQSWLKKQGLTK